MASQAHTPVLVMHTGLERPSVNTTAPGELFVGFFGIGPNPSNAALMPERAGA